MKQPKAKSFKLLGTGTLLLTALMGPVLVAMGDFHSEQIEYVVMEAQVGGEIDPAQGFRIKHTPLRGVSRVTKIALIQGVVGANLAAFNNIGIGKAGDISAAAITIKLRLQHLDKDGNPQGNVEEQIALFYSEPAQFQFQISPESITEGGFKYQILAEKKNGDGEVIAKTAMPTDAFANADSWINLNPTGVSPVIGPSGGRVVILDANPNDGDSLLDISPNVLKGPTQVSLTEVAVDDPFIPGLNGTLAPYAIYKLEAEPPLTGAVRVSVLYPEFIPSTNGWQLAGQEVPESKLSLAIWDGFTWKAIGGKIDAINKTLTARAGAFSYLGVFSSFAAPSAQSIANNLQKIITPNGDGQNDEADFSGIGMATKVEIFDITGHRVRTLNGPSNILWDGKDDSGSVVESGVYLYQFSEGGERVSGVIGVAK